MPIPEIQGEVLVTIAREVNKDWVIKVWKQLLKEQPVLAMLIEAGAPEPGDFITMLSIYKIIEAQIEVSDLEELYGNS